MSLRWGNRSVIEYSGTIPELNEHIPTFGRKPLSLGGGHSENKYVDMVYKTCSPNDTAEVPVASVSKSYSLIQHRHITDTIGSSMDDLGHHDMNFDLKITEYGERMWLAGMFPDTEIEMDDGYPLKMQLHIINSVDQSKSLTMELGWWREICSNGLMVMLAGEKLRARHTASLDVERTTKWVKRIAPNMQSHGKRVQEWQGIELNLHGDRQVLIDWINNTVSEKWSRRNACRTYNIIKSAHDCDIARRDLMDINETATELVATTGDHVLGQRVSENLYDVANALTYVSSHQKSIATRLSYMSDVPDMVENLKLRIERA